MKKLKKICALMLIAAFVSFGLTGCNSKNEHPTSEHPSKKASSEEHPTTEASSEEHPTGEHPK